MFLRLRFNPQYVILRYVRNPVRGFFKSMIQSFGLSVYFWKIHSHIPCIIEKKYAAILQKQRKEKRGV